MTLFDSRDILAQNLIMQQKLGATNVAILQRNLASAKAVLRDRFKPTADKLGLEVQPFYYDDTTDWTTFAATVLSTNPDGIDMPAAQDAECLAAIPAFRNAGFEGTLHASSCAEYVDKLPIEQATGIINHNEFFYPTMEEDKIPAKAKSDLAIFDKYMKRDVPNLNSIVYGQLGFHIAVQAADMLRQVEGEITPESVAAAMPTTKGPMFFRESGYDCSENYWPPDSAACSAEVVYTRLNKDKVKEILDINPINTDAVRRGEADGRRSLEGRSATVADRPSEQPGGLGRLHGALVAEVARLEQLGVLAQLGRVARGDDLAVSEDVAAVGDPERGEDVLLDEQHGHAPLVGDLTDRREQLLDDDRRQPEAHLVEHHHLRVGDEGPGECQHLLLAAREQSGPAWQHAPQRREVLQHGVDVDLRLAVLTQAQVVGHGELVEQAAPLRHDAEAASGDLVRLAPWARVRPSPRPRRRGPAGRRRW